jgi:predicted lipoprotein with Yx(FWY)xxD motif
MAVGATVAAIGGFAAVGAEGSAYAASAHPAAVAALKVASVKVAGSKHMVLVNSAGRAVYLLTGDSTSHPICTGSACLSDWPAVTTTAKKPVLGKGIKGKLTVWTHGKSHQLVLNGHPLYTFADDSSAGTANGQGLKSFGGTWELLTGSGSAFTNSSSKSSGSNSAAGSWS